MPEEEEQLDGIAGLDPGIEFPITAYDRGTLGLSNLLARGDVDAMTRSFLAPQTLSPAELKTFRGYLTRGRKPGPFMKTLLDITTNPLFVMGMLMSLKFPMIKVNQLSKLFDGAIKVKSVGQTMSYIHAPFANLRHIPGAFKKVADYVLDVAGYMRLHGKKLQELHRASGRLSKEQSIGAGALGQGFNLAAPAKGTEAYRVMKYYGLSAADGPLMPGLQGKLRPEGVKFSGGLKTWLERVGRTVGQTKTGNRVTATLNELHLKGLGQWVDDYWPRFTQMDQYGQEGLKRAVKEKGQAALTDSIVKKGVGSSIKARAKGIPSMWDAVEMKEMFDAGYLNPLHYAKMTAKLAADKSAFTANLMQSVNSGLASSNPIGWKAHTLRWMNKDFGVNLKLRVGNSKTGRRNTMEFIRERLTDAQKIGPKRLAQEIEEVATAFSSVPSYSLNASTVPARYLKTVGNTWGWHVKGHGKLLTGITDTLKPGWDKDYLMNNLFPHLRGMRSQGQYNWYSWFGAQKEATRRWIKHHPMFNHIPKKLRLTLQKPFQADSGGLGYESSMGKVANWFYLTTLGMPNVAPTFKNTLQTIVTTTNMVGPKAIGVGYQKLAPDWLKFIKLSGGGMPREQAFRKAFPRFVRYTGDIGEFLDQMLAGDLMAKGAGLGPKAAGAWGKIKTAMLTPFAASETLHNRLLTFYATDAKAIAGGLSLKKAGELGANMVMHTQFSGGVLGMPRAIMNLPAPLRQFAYFPLRFLGFLHSSVRMGADPSKVDWGIISRTLAGSTAAYHVGKNILGTDLSQGLMFGALPGPSFEGSPFFPSPFTPPALGVVGTLAQAAVTGETRPLGNAAALLTPGGIGFKRIHKTLSPRYADYKNRTPEGRIPLYGRNRALVGTFTPFQLVLRSFGITPTSMAGEWGGAKWLLTQREQLRGYRREYLEALSHNDMGRAGRVNRDFEKQYPELGPIKVKKSDIRAIQNRREVSRLNRILKGFPKQYRPLFEQIATQAVTEQVFQDVKSSPQALQWYEDAARGL